MRSRVPNSASSTRVRIWREPLRCSRAGWPTSTSSRARLRPLSSRLPLFLCRLGAPSQVFDFADEVAGLVDTAARRFDGLVDFPALSLEDGGDPFELTHVGRRFLQIVCLREGGGMRAERCSCTSRSSLIFHPSVLR